MACEFVVITNTFLSTSLVTQLQNYFFYAREKKVSCTYCIRGKNSSLFILEACARTSAIVQLAVQISQAYENNAVFPKYRKHSVFTLPRFEVGQN